MICVRAFVNFSFGSDKVAFSGVSITAMFCSGKETLLPFDADFNIFLDDVLLSMDGAETTAVSISGVTVPLSFFTIAVISIPSGDISSIVLESTLRFVSMYPCSGTISALAFFDVTDTVLR